MSDPATKEDIQQIKGHVEHVQDQVSRLADVLSKLRRYAPSVAEKRAKWYRFGYELSGLAVLAAGAWCVYRPAALILVGGWMLAEVVTSRRRKGG